jgi:SAM-dependent methyltransferase
VASAIPTTSDPRWGQLGRDSKAEDILATLQLHCGPSIADQKWLDLGCGSGGVAATLAATVSEVVGIDPEPWARWQDFQEKYENLSFYKGSYLNLVELLGKGSVDVVVCNQVYEHVDDPFALLDAINKVMKPSGICYFAGPNLLWPIEPHVFWPFVHWLPRRFAIGMMKACRARYANCLDAWSWPYWKLTRAFRNAGFQYCEAISDRLQVHADRRKTLSSQLIARMPRWLISIFAPLSPGFIFVLTKPPVILK